MDNQLKSDNVFFSQPKAIWAITFACTISFMGIGLIDPIIPSIAIKLNASPSQVSLLFSSYILVMSFAMLITGFVSSRLGQKWTMLTGLILIVIFSFICGLSNNIWQLVWLRGGWGLGNALFIATALTSIVELSNGGIARAIILYEAAIGLGFSVGPLLGGELGSISWRCPFFGVSVLLVIAIVSLFMLLPALPKKQTRNSALDPIKALLHYRGLLTVGITALLYYVGFFILLAYSPFTMHLNEHGLGYVFFGWGLMLAISSVFVANKVEHLFGMLNGIYLSLFLFAIDLLIMGLWSNNSKVIIITVIIAGIFIGINSTLITTAVMNSAPIDRSVISSAYNCIRFLGGAIGPWLAGILAEQYGHQTPFFIGAFVVLTSIAVLWFGREHLNIGQAKTNKSLIQATHQGTLLYNYRILVPIDGSGHSEHAVHHAKAFAQKMGKRTLVTLLHVNPRILLNELPDADIHINELVEQETQNIIGPARNQLNLAHIKHDVISVFGEPAETICSTALEGQYGLIIMGSRGLSPLPGAILGSVSNDVVQHSHCPVFIVK